MAAENKHRGQEESGDFDRRLLDKMKAENLSPKPRWRFLLKNYVVWISGALALLIGAAAVSVIAFLGRYHDWRLYAAAKASAWEIIILALPYFWLIFLAIFVFIVYYNFKHTRGGYRYPLAVIVSGSILASLLLGLFFFRLGLGRAIDDLLGARAPFYREVINPQMGFWLNPEDGRLVGIVQAQSEEGTLAVADPEGNIWEVELDLEEELLPIMMDDRFAEFGPIATTADLIMAGQPLSFIGEITEEGSFKAKLVHPLVPGRRFLERGPEHLRKGGQGQPDCPGRSCHNQGPRFQAVP